jgi:NADPH:quinone reductase-like Zn-dependent oxidoreductase
MRASVFHSYGMNVMKVEELQKPTPKDNEVLVKVCASSVNPAEWYNMTGFFLARLGNGLFKPKDSRLGTDFAGVVEAVGRVVTDFKPGDEVFGGRSGAFAEYVCVQKGIAHKPANITFEQAGVVGIAGLTALQGLRDHANIQPGQKVLINGAAGGVGTFAVQIARAFGAEVTGVCSTKNVDMIRSLGADHVIDYTKEDFTRNRQRYDLLLDIAGNRSWSEYRRVLTPKATVVIIGGPKGKIIGPLKHIIAMRVASFRASQKVIFFVANFNRDDLVVLSELMKLGKVKPIVDRTYPLNKINEAMSYLGTGHARAKIAITTQ